MNPRFWTFDTLVAAFLDLFIAYFLLSASTIAFFAVKFLGFFGLSLQLISSDYRRLLVDYPTDKLSAVQFSVTRKFPFDSNEDLNLNRGDGNDNDNGEGDQAYCSSKSDVVIGKESGFDVKGKGGLNYRLKDGFRRRRKARFDSCKHSSVSCSSNWVTCVDQQSINDDEQIGSSFVSDVNNCNYEAETPMVVKSVSRYHEDIVSGDPIDAHNRIPVNEADKEKMVVLLSQELEESQAARAALYAELEKERNAAATAAEEAMSMILRLQEEKASTTMEFCQYRRTIEEKSAFDAEEMNILKEIVLRREREKHFLEKQVEAYRQMIYVENGQTDLMLTSRLYEDVDFSKQVEPERTIVIVREEKGLEIKRADASRGDETSSCAYDVHVIDNEPKASQRTNGNKRQTNHTQSGSETSLRRNSASALDNERTRLDTEVEWLRERLRIVQEGREKLKFSVENREKESLQLELLENIARQLQEIRLLTEPQTARQASLRAPSSKADSTKKRRYRSVSSGHNKSS